MPVATVFRVSCWPARLPQRLAVACPFAVDPSSTPHEATLPYAVCSSAFSSVGISITLLIVFVCVSVRRLSLSVSVSLFFSSYVSLSISLSVCLSVRLTVFLTRLSCRWLSVVFLQYFVCYCYGCFYHQSILLSPPSFFFHSPSCSSLPACVCFFNCRLPFILDKYKMKMILREL